MIERLKTAASIACGVVFLVLWLAGCWLSALGLGAEEARLQSEARQGPPRR